MQIFPQENIYYRVRDGQPYLIGTRCHVCGYVAYPKKLVCPMCLVKDTMDEVELSRRGKLDTFSVLYVGAPGFNFPYIVGYVVLPEGPRVFTMITGCEPSEESLKIGTEMEMVLGKIRNEDGDEVVGYQFQPVKGKG